MNITLAGILLAVTFIGFIVYLVKGYNMILGFLSMAIIWSIIGGVPYLDIVNNVIASGITSYGNVGFTIIFGSWFGQILMKTGITSTIIRKAVELGGDRPLVVSILLCIITALIFTSSFGSGVVIAIGLIILPILFALGVPKELAVGAYIMSIGTGVMLNMVHFSQLATLISGYEYDQFIPFALIAMAINQVFIVMMLAFGLRKTKVVHPWAAGDLELPEATAPVYSFLVPIVPILMAIFLKWHIIPSFMVAIFLALLLTGKLSKPKQALSMAMQAVHSGVADVGILIITLTMINIFQTSAGNIQHIFQELLGPVMPSSAFVLAILVGVLAPISLFRGPLSFWGTGVATISVLAGLGIFNPAFLFPLMCIPTNFMATAICPTQGWNMWGLSYGKVTIRNHFKTTFVWAWLACIVAALLCYFMYGML